MRRIKLFEDFKVNNINQEDIVKTILNDGKILTTVIKDLPNHNDEDYVKPISIDGDDITIDVDGQTYTTQLKFVTRVEH